MRTVCFKETTKNKDPTRWCANAKHVTQMDSSKPTSSESGTSRVVSCGALIAIRVSSVLQEEASYNTPICE
jgi:hypothetical protein